MITLLLRLLRLFPFLCGGHRQLPLERAHAISRKWELASWLANVPEERGFAYACSGRLAEGAGLLEESLQAYGALGRHPLTIHMGEAYLLAGRPDDAWAFGAQTLALARRLGQRRLEALALYLLGEVTSSGDSLPVRAGGDRYGQAMGLAAVLGMRPLVAHGHLGLGKLARHVGDGERARTGVGTAATMYREMGLHCWLEKAEAEGVTPSTNELPAGGPTGGDRLISQGRS